LRQLCNLDLHATNLLYGSKDWWEMQLLTKICLTMQSFLN
jgi:hypothetical protein